MAETKPGPAPKRESRTLTSLNLPKDVIIIDHRYKKSESEVEIGTSVGGGLILTRLNGKPKTQRRKKEYILPH